MENQNPAPESQPAPRKRLTEDDLVAQLLEPKAPTEDKPEVTTAEAATRTDNNDHDHLDDKRKQAVKEKAEQVEDADEGEESTEEEDDAEEVEEPQEEPEEADEDAEESEEADEASEDDEVYFTTPDGEEVTLDELKRGFLRQSDYTRKTQEVAQQRQQIEQVAQAFEQHNSVLAEHLNMALDVLEPQLAELSATKWDQLAAADPYEYAEKRALFDQAQARYQQLKQAAHQTVQMAQQRAEAQKRQYLQQEQQKLQMALPELADAKVGRKLAQSIRDYGLSMGLSEKEASSIVDHRIVVMMNKARMFDELNGSKLSAAKKKISKAPKKAVRSGTPSSKSETAQSKRMAQRRRVKETGSVDALVDLLMSRG